ncbi:MAG: DNA methylase [Promethearchaeota archaeon CR_4]|nr:MAG: DNA methylase [Candidatus Lokiarchaeota archaeon CR_4]
MWYAKNKTQLKYHPLYSPKKIDDLNLNLYRFVEEKDGTRRILSKEERANPRLIPAGARIYRIGDLTSQGSTQGSSSQPFEFEGKTYTLGKNSHWKTTQAGLRNLAKNHRIQSTRSNIYYVRFLEDFPVNQLNNIWTDTGTGGYNDPKIYAVQTNTKVVQRCILMTTDPGDLVLDPTCGSGTTAVVAEQWGRRWISCDTSQIAIFLARQRLMTAIFPYYILSNPADGVKRGFQYQSVSHVKLRNLAFDESPIQEALFNDPIIDSTKIRVSGFFTIEKFSGLRDFPEHLVITLVSRLQKDGISFPDGRQIAIVNVKTNEKGAIQATGEIMKDGQQKKVALAFNTPYNPLGSSQVTQTIVDAGRGFELVFFLGFHFLPETQTCIQIQQNHSPQLALISINPEILLEELLPDSKGNQIFTLVGRPAITLEFTPEKKQVHVEFQGIQYFNPFSDEFYSLPSKDMAAWFLDEDYDGHTFYIHQCGFLGRKNPWLKMQRQSRRILEEGDFQRLRSLRSNDFPCYKGQKIAVKLFDSRGGEVSSIMTL